MGKPNLEVFAKTLEELAAADRDLVVVTSDSRGSGKLGPFGENFPAQIVETGIAEQNLVGMSAGLASCGKKVFAVSPACFLTARALEQIKNDVAYSDQPVKLIGISAGVSYGALGSTHHSLHDFAVLRTIHNLTIVAPADKFETEESVKWAYGYEHPVYIRFGKKAMPVLHDNNSGFVYGKGIEVRGGNDLAIIATGECVAPALGASLKLEKEKGIKARVISMHTLKPLDMKILFRAARECDGMITVEEHSVYGGLGEACASGLLANGYSLPFKILGIPDEYTVTGSQSEIFTHYGLSPGGIAAAAIKLLKTN
ncbi:MAG: transketolase family protein [Cyclobacteriaceae bacterium]|nr:transketolase family protein [Cyclobacteriaceae bacterium]